jgi:hypothetical protein
MGQRSINSLNDNQNEAIVMNANYELSRDKVLGDAAWTFATERQVLAPVADTLAFGRGNKFLIPSDVLRVFRVYRSTNTSQTDKFMNADWVREGRYIISAEEALWAVFIMKVSDPNLFSPSFVHALAARLAADTAITFTESIKMEEKMEQRYMMKLADAKYADGSQGTTEVVRSSRLTGTRKR